MFASIVLATYWSADLGREFLPFMSATMLQHSLDLDWLSLTLAWTKCGRWQHMQRNEVITLFLEIPCRSSLCSTQNGALVCLGSLTSSRMISKQSSRLKLAISRTTTSWKQTLTYFGYGGCCGTVVTTAPEQSALWTQKWFCPAWRKVEALQRRSCAFCAAWQRCSWPAMF